MLIRSINDISNGKLNSLSTFDKIYKFFNGKELSSDFVFTDYNEISQYNELLGKLSNKFFVFATTGQGDLWLINKKDKNVYYYNHDVEDIIESNFINTNLDIYKWLTAGDLFKQMDNLIEQDKLTEDEQIKFRELIRKNMSKLLDIFCL